MFPPDARFAFIDVQRIASTSSSGKLAARSATASVLYLLPAPDISDEVIKRVDAQPKKQP